MCFTEEFLQLPVDSLCELLQRTSLSVETEDAIFDSIMRWVRHEVDTRKPLLKQLISHVHVDLLRERYVQEFVIPDELIRSCGLESWVLSMRQGGNFPKQQRGFTNVIVVAGGEGPCAK